MDSSFTSKQGFLTAVEMTRQVIQDLELQRTYAAFSEIAIIAVASALR
jgi:hypothetical protein